ncbi:hypothetical protein [Variovorax sp. HJSM1_2]|uniref:hypothetical protein n=1 Tax=Variovorax sp. HJSM1_2 TaxID=3366263 RepID=UPI003BE01803
MKPVVVAFLGLALSVSALPVLAQASVYRCGNEYTNAVKDAKDAQARGCKLVEGGNVTVIQTPRTSGGSAASPAPVRAPSAGQRVDNADQRARDSDARMILESELKKAETRRGDLLKEYNNGEPDKLGPETRNYQKYLDRVAELKASIDRADAEIASLQRELSRLPSSR